MPRQSTEIYHDYSDYIVVYRMGVELTVQNLPIRLTPKIYVCEYYVYYYNYFVFLFLNLTRLWYKKSLQKHLTKQTN